jgi:hypothetical protein
MKTQQEMENWEGYATAGASSLYTEESDLIDCSLFR